MPEELFMVVERVRAKDSASVYRPVSGERPDGSLRAFCMRRVGPTRHSSAAFIDGNS